MDQLVSETITTLHPDSRRSTVLTNALRFLMEVHAEQLSPDELVELVASDVWRFDRPAVITEHAAKWLAEERITERQALMLAEVEVMAIEALASHWQPEQCRVMAVKIDGTPRLSMVCALEGFSA